MKTDPFLAAYFKRIGYSGNAAPTLSTLRELHWLHPAAIPFENLDSFLGRPVRLDDEALFDKLVRDRRGGYCFEHNLLFLRVLLALAFEARSLAARVMWGRPADMVVHRSHMLLLVTLEGQDWIADVGFGGLTATGPLRLGAAGPQPTPHEPFRIVAQGADNRVEARTGEDWRWLYRFDLSEQLRPDHEVANWFVSTHPQSIFVTTLMAARALPDRRLALAGNRLTEHGANGSREDRLLGSPDELAMILQRDFEIEVPDLDAFGIAASEKIFATP